MQCFADRYRYFLKYSPTVFVAHIPSLAEFGVDAVADGDTGHGCARLQAFLNDLGFERLRIELRWRMEILAIRAIASA
jgi:hypothetical protein